MSRTPEQAAADDNLSAAIEQVMNAYRDDQHQHAYVLAEYVVLGSHHRIDDDGDPVTAVSVIYRDGDVPTHRALGLIEYGRTRVKAYINAPEYDDN